LSLSFYAETLVKFKKKFSCILVLKYFGAGLLLIRAPIIKKPTLRLKLAPGLSWPFHMEGKGSSRVFDNRVVFFKS
jgi:hypothetical protein